MFRCFLVGKNGKIAFLSLGTPVHKDDFCALHAGIVSQGEEDEDEPVAARTRSKAVAQTMTSEQGCVKTFFAHRNHTTGCYVRVVGYCLPILSGLLVFARPCGVIVHLSEMVQGESTHDVAQGLFELHQRGLVMETCVYDNACHLDQSIVKNTPHLKFLDFAIDRFHAVCICPITYKVCMWRAQVNHKCTGYEADRLPGLIGVNTEVCEQLFKWLSRCVSVRCMLNCHHIHNFQVPFRLRSYE